MPNSAAPAQAQHANARSLTRGDSLVAVVLGLLGTVVSAIGSWIPSYWGDEAASIMSATRPIRSLIDMSFNVDAVHSLYYALLNVWINLFGASPFSTRFPSALAIGVTVALGYLLVRMLANGRGVAVASAVLIAVQPRLTYAGEEARSFAATAALATLATLIVVAVLQRRIWPRTGYVLYAVVMVFGAYLFLYLLILMAAHAVLLLWHHRRDVRSLVGWVVTAFAICVLSLPIAITAYNERSQIKYLKSVDDVNPKSVSIDAFFWSSGALAIVTAVILIAALAAAVLRSTRRGPTPRASALTRLAPRGFDDADARAVGVAASWLFVPFAIFLLISALFSGFTLRYVTFLAPAVAILTAFGVYAIGCWLRFRIPALVAGTLAIVLLCVPMWSQQRGPNAKVGSDWAEIGAYIRVHAEKGDAIAFDQATQPSRRPRLALHTYPQDFTKVEDPLLIHPYSKTKTWYDTAHRIDEGVREGRFDGYDRIWVVEYAPRGGTPDDQGLAELEAHGWHRVSAKVLYSSRIYLYER